MQSKNDYFSGMRFKSYNDVIRSYSIYLNSLDYEELIILYLDLTKRWVLNEFKNTIYSKIESGSVDITTILRKAIMSKGNYMVMLHNHINEDPTPSENDKNLVTALYLSGNLINIPLLDSYITTNLSNDIFSMKENKIIRLK